MNNTRKLRFERDARCVGFADERPTDFSPDTPRGKCAARLKSILAEIEKLDAESVTHVRLKQQGTSAKNDEIETLKRLINTYSDTAEVIAPEHPEIEGVFGRLKANSNEKTILATARHFVDAAPAFLNRFVEYDLPPDINDRFKNAIARFEESSSRKERGASAKASDEAAIDDLFRRADQELERMDVFVRNKYGDDPATMAAWERARRLGRPRPSKSRRGKTGEGSGEPDKEPQT